MRPREHYVQQLEALHTEIRALGQMVIVSITRAIDALRRQDTERRGGSGPTTSGSTRPRRRWRNTR